MISVKELAERLQAMLDANGADRGVSFKIFDDFGELENGVTNNKVCGLLEFLPSQVIGQGFQFLLLSTRLRFYIDGTGMNRRQFATNIDIIKGVLNSFLAQYNNVPQNTQFEGNNYSMTMNIGVPQNLPVTKLGYMGKALPIEMYITFNILMNGVSSNDIKFNLDGNDIFARSYSITRARVNEASVKNGEDSAKNIEKSNGISVAINTAVLNDNIGKIVTGDILKGKPNQAHVLRIETPLNEYGAMGGTQLAKNYIVIFGDNTINGEDGKNAGTTINLVEADEDIVEFGDTWITLTARENNPKLWAEEGSLIIWGNGESVEADADKIYTTYLESYPQRVLVQTQTAIPEAVRVEILGGEKVVFNEYVAGGEKVDLFEWVPVAYKSFEKWKINNVNNNPANSDEFQDLKGVYICGDVPVFAIYNDKSRIKFNCPTDCKLTAIGVNSGIEYENGDYVENDAISGINFTASVDSGSYHVIYSNVDFRTDYEAGVLTASWSKNINQYTNACIYMGWGFEPAITRSVDVNDYSAYGEIVSIFDNSIVNNMPFKYSATIHTTAGDFDVNGYTNGNGNINVGGVPINVYFYTPTREKTMFIEVRGGNQQYHVTSIDVTLEQLSLAPRG